MPFPLPCRLVELKKARGVNLTQIRGEGPLGGFCSNLANIRHPLRLHGCCECIDLSLLRRLFMWMERKWVLFGQDTCCWNLSPGSAETAILWTRYKSGEDTSSVTVTVDGKNTGSGSLPVISFPNLAYNYGERQGSHSTLGWLVNHIVWLRPLNLDRPKDNRYQPPGQGCFSQGPGSWSYYQRLKVMTLKLDLKGKRNAKSLPLRTGTWYVRTMLTGLDNMDLSHSHIRKTAVIDRELPRLNLDIVALQETRIVGSRSLKEKKIILFSGKALMPISTDFMVLALLSETPSLPWRISTRYRGVIPGLSIGTKLISFWHKALTLIVSIMRNFHSADCDRDHTLHVSKWSVKAKSKHHSKLAPKPKNKCQYV